MSSTVPMVDSEIMSALHLTRSNDLWAIASHTTTAFKTWMAKPNLTDNNTRSVQNKRAPSLEGAPLYTAPPPPSESSTDRQLAVVPLQAGRRRHRSTTPTDDPPKKQKGQGGRGRVSSQGGRDTPTTNDINTFPIDNDGGLAGGTVSGGGGGGGVGRSTGHYSQLLERQAAELDATRARVVEMQQASTNQYEVTLRHEREMQQQQQQVHQQSLQQMQHQSLQQMRQMMGATLLQSAMNSNNQQSFSGLAPGLLDMMGGAAGTASFQPPVGPSLMSTSLLNQHLPHQTPQLQPQLQQQQQLQQQLQLVPQPPPQQPLQQQLAVIGAPPAPVAAAAAAADGEGPNLTVDQLNTQITTLATQLAHLGPNHAAAPIYQATLAQRQQQLQTKLNQQFNC